MGGRWNLLSYVRQRKEQNEAWGHLMAVMHELQVMIRKPIISL